MEVRISDLIAKKERSKNINYKFNEKQFEFEGETIKYVEPCEVIGKISSDLDVLILNANIRTKLEMVCSRCLDTFIYPIDIDIEERFTTNPDCTDEEALVVMNDVLNITEIVENSIISTLPIQRVCKDDCKGLCQECGVNLNNETCSCYKGDVDIRFEALKGLFDNKEV